MGRRMRALCAILVTLACTNPVAAQSTSYGRVLPRTLIGDHYAWRWQVQLEPKTLVAIDLIRAVVVIHRSKTKFVAVNAVSIGDLDQARDLALKIENTPDGLRLYDAFPPRASYRRFAECLPPEGMHGDFWSNTTRLRIVLEVPDDVQVSGHVMDGDILDRRLGNK